MFSKATRSFIMKTIGLISLGLTVACSDVFAEGKKFDTSIPRTYRKTIKETGTVEKLTYDCYYYTDLTDMGVNIQPIYDETGYTIEKRDKPISRKLNVYLPYNYTASKMYPYVFILHGITGNEDDYLRSNDIKNLIDNLIASGTVEPFIAVFPNGNSSATFENRSFENQAGYYFFGNELIHDIIPLLESKYSVRKDRDDRAICGFSMGGMQTLNVGMAQCLSYFSKFGAFAAAPTSYPAAKLLSLLDKETESAQLPITLLYALCGTEDMVAGESHKNAVTGLEKGTKYFNTENFYTQLVPGNHDGNVCSLGIFNFLKAAFAK